MLEFVNPMTRELAIRSQNDSAAFWEAAFDYLGSLINKASHGSSPMIVSMDAIQYQTAAANQSRITRALMGIPYTWNDTDVDAPADTIVPTMSDLVGSVITDIYINAQGQFVFKLDLNGNEIEMRSYTINDENDNLMDPGDVQYRGD